MLKLNNVSRTYSQGEGAVTVLKNVNITARSGEFISITGHSGSGKSTLLAIMAGLDKPSTGQVYLGEQLISNMPESELAHYRGRMTGFIFQNYQLMPTLTAIENVMVPSELLNLGSYNQIKDRATRLLHQVGLQHREHHYPSQLSGGEMQRVAIARALITEPKVLFADEPTGNLDSKNGQMVLQLLTNLHAEATLVLVTHNPELAKLADREIRLRDGELVSEIEHRGGTLLGRTLEGIRQWLPL